MKKRKLFIAASLFMLLFCFGENAKAQQADTASNPLWIKMMDDPNANYRQAIKAFNDFWENKEKPIEEKEVFEAQAKKTNRREPKEEAARKYAFQYKRFLNWQRETAPYVQADGRILSKTERLALWEQEKNMRAQSQN